MESPRRKSPEERELEKKRTELAQLEPMLAEKELELATLRASMADFERNYLNKVGVRYAELDDLEAKMYEAAAKLVPDDLDARLKAEAAAEQARASAEATAEAEQQAEEDKKNGVPKTEFKASEGLKKLFRSVAKSIHPDLADGEEDRARRHQFMIRANAVYARGDEKGLEQILVEWEHSPEFVKGHDIAAELVRAIRKIARGEDRLVQIDEEIAQLKRSELAALRGRVEIAHNNGRDLLEDMARRVQNEIEEARKRLKQFES